MTQTCMTDQLQGYLCPACLRPPQNSGETTVRPRP
jgi:hypothetical protein